MPTADDSICKSDPDCLSSSIALLKNVRVGLIDPDTPDTDDVRTRTANDGTKLKLVVRCLALIFNLVIPLTRNSSQTSSTQMVEHSMEGTTPFSKQLICGTESRRIWNGTTQTQFRLLMEH